MSERVYLVDKAKFMANKDDFDGLVFWKESQDPKGLEVKIAIFDSITLLELKKIMI